MPMYGQILLLLGSVGLISALSVILFYRLVVRVIATSEAMARDISSIVTELISAKTFAETGNDRLATNMLSHSTNWQNTQKKVPIHHPIEAAEEELLQTVEPQIGPAISDIEILGEDDGPPANLE